MPVASIARPIKPPSASISRTRCPFAVPPIAGLQGICATVSVESVHNPTCAPRRAAAYAASHPAWPLPMTMTSNEFFIRRSTLLSHTEPREDVLQQIVRRALAGNLLERRARLLQIRQHEFLRQRGAVGTRRVVRSDQRLARALHERQVTHVADVGPIARLGCVDLARHSTAPVVET